MSSVNYDEVISRLLLKIEPYDFLELSNDEVEEFFVGWLHSATADPYFRKVFSSFILDDEIREINYQLSYSIDDYTDQEFVVETISYGMGLKWLSPKINSLNNIAQKFGSSDQKWYSQAMHLSELRAIRKDWMKEFHSMIAGRQVSWNSYLDGES